MQSPDKSTFPCTVALLTYNSAGTLARCLDTLKGFGEILIADGGSTDGTLEIAKSYGARIISQSDPGHPISDFSLERNRLVEAAKYDWFFYVDSDEVIEPQLAEDIRKIVEAPITHHAYRVRYKIASEDLKTIYKSWKPYYQIRFFNRQCQGKFRKKMHEKLAFDRSKYSVRTINSAWLVPLDIQLSFDVYKQKVEKRLGVMTNNWKSTSRKRFLQDALVLPFIAALKTFVKAVALRLRFRSRDLVPFRYEMYRIYSQWVMARNLWKKHSKVLLVHTAVRNSKEVWNKQFAAGRWDYLANEQANTLYLASICERYVDEGMTKILDVGCGNGAFLKAFLDKDKMSRFPKENFVGIDFSDTALEAARVNCPRAEFVRGDLESSPLLRTSFDIIIASEVLYYCNPIKFVDAYEKYLADDGVYIISMYKSWRSTVAWWKLSKRLKPLFSKSIAGDNGKEKWVVKVMIPKTEKQ